MHFINYTDVIFKKIQFLELFKINFFLQWPVDYVTLILFSGSSSWEINGITDISLLTTAKRVSVDRSGVITLEKIDGTLQTSYTQALKGNFTSCHFNGLVTVWNYWLAVFLQKLNYKYKKTLLFPTPIHVLFQAPLLTSPRVHLKCRHQTDNKNLAAKIVYISKEFQWCRDWNILLIHIVNRWTDARSVNCKKKSYIKNILLNSVFSSGYPTSLFKQQCP